MLKQKSKSKSPLTLLILISFLVISTLVMISNYFLRPGLESDLRNRITATLSAHNIVNAVIKVQGRDVILNGIAANPLIAKKAESDIKSIAGINAVRSKLVIEKQDISN